jgi:sugar lactone lactonase YvrE
MELAHRGGINRPSPRPLASRGETTDAAMSESFPSPQVVHEARARLGEGPVWDERTRTLFWIDILNYRVHQFFPDRGTGRVFEVGDLVGSVALTESDSLLLALRHRLARLDLVTGEVEHLVDVEEGKDDNKLNDGKPDARGRFWFGSFSQNEGEAALYRYDPDGSLHVMQEGMTGSNGLGWSPDGRTFYLTDSGEKRIYAYDFDTASGRIDGRRVFVDLADREPTPDGLTVDEAGHVWTAQFDGGEVLRFSPEGRQVGRIEVPAVRTTSCAFGGADRTRLYITTASVGLSEQQIEENFHSGDLFAVETGIVGQAFHRFGG